MKFDRIYRAPLGLYLSAFRHRGRFMDVLSNWPSHNVQASGGRCAGRVRRAPACRGGSPLESAAGMHVTTGMHRAGMQRMFEGRLAGQHGGMNALSTGYSRRPALLSSARLVPAARVVRATQPRAPISAQLQPWLCSLRALADHCRDRWQPHPGPGRPGHQWWAALGGLLLTLTPPAALLPRESAHPRHLPLQNLSNPFFFAYPTHAHTAPPCPHLSTHTSTPPQALVSPSERWPYTWRAAASTQSTRCPSCWMSGATERRCWRTGSTW